MPVSSRTAELLSCYYSHYNNVRGCVTALCVSSQHSVLTLHRHWSL